MSSGPGCLYDTSHDFLPWRCCAGSGIPHHTNSHLPHINYAWDVASNRAKTITRKFHLAQVLDLCLWQREFSSGLGGTGRDVGVGGVRFGEAPLRRQQAATSPRLKEAGAAALPPPPVGCRYLRVHRPVDRHSKVTSVRIDSTASVLRTAKTITR